MVNIAIFASGSGTNAENIVKYFTEKGKHKVKIILTNNKNAGVIKRAENLNVSIHIFSKKELFESNEILEILTKNHIDWIVLAGFLHLIPENLIQEYKNKIVNIHPALLPSYGGKGMYGDRVHKAVIQNNENKSGITIHFVNSKYDEGEIIFQAECEVNEEDNAESLAKKIHALEYKHYPRVLEGLFSK